MNTLEIREKTRNMLCIILGYKRMKQYELAKELNINRCTISQYITCVKTPTTENYLKIHEYYENVCSDGKNTN